MTTLDTPLLITTFSDAWPSLWSVAETERALRDDIETITFRNVYCDDAEIQAKYQRKAEAVVEVTDV